MNFSAKNPAIAKLQTVTSNPKTTPQTSIEPF